MNNIMLYHLVLIQHNIPCFIFYSPTKLNEVLLKYSSLGLHSSYINHIKLLLIKDNGNCIQFHYNNKNLQDHNNS